MGRPVASLDSSGWNFSVDQKANRLMSYFLIAEYSQSYVFFGSVKSLPKIVQQNTNDMLTLSQDIRTALKALYDAHFERVDLDVKIVPIKAENGDPTNMIEIQIDCTVAENGKTYSLGRLLNFEDGILSRVTNL